VALLALTLRFALLGWAWSHGNRLLQPGVWDEQGYHLLAVNIVRHHRFAIANLTDDPELRRAAGFIASLPAAEQQDYLRFLDTDRTPGLPLFMAAVYAIAGPSPWAVAATLCALSAAAAAIVCLAVTTAVSPRAGAAAGVLMALSPGAILNSCQILSDTLHMVLLAAFLLALVCALKRQSGVMGGVAGLCLGAAALVRPVTLYLPLVLAAVLFVARVRPRTWIWLLVGAYAAVLPWCARNAVAYGRPMLSNIGAYNMLHYNLAYAKAGTDGLSVEQVARMYDREAAKLRGGARALITRDLPRYWPAVLRNQAVGAVAFWASADRLYWSQILTGRMAWSHALERMWDAGPATAARRILRSPGAAPAIVQAAYNGLATLLALAGAVLCLRRKVARTEVMVALCCCAYYSLVTGPVASGRFRLAVDPFVAMLAGAAVAGLWELARRGKPQLAHEVS